MKQYLLKVAIAAAVASSGCEGASDPRQLSFVLDFTLVESGLRDRVAAVDLEVLGDSVPYHRRFGVDDKRRMEIKDGQTQFTYFARIRVGTLRVVATLVDSEGGVLTSGAKDVAIGIQNRVTVTIRFGDEPTNGSLDAGRPPALDGASAGMVLAADAMTGAEAGNTGGSPGARADSGIDVTATDGRPADVVAPPVDAPASTDAPAPDLAPDMTTAPDMMMAMGMTCGNGVIDPGELCDPKDPVFGCPTSCPQQGCMLRLLDAPGTCSAQCLPSGTQTLCTAGDGCCGSGCNSANDPECKPGCGNGIVETGELCDGNCPTTCLPMGCMLRKLNNAGTCTAACVDNGAQTACMNGDACCPAGCNATNDGNCTAMCGNGVKEQGELCDPKDLAGPCPTVCPQMGCNLRRLDMAGTCSAQCVDSGTQTACMSGDGCCPTGCNATNDNECKPGCPNGIVEPGELCDGNCPTLCPWNVCMRRKLTGDPAMCSAQCIDDGTQTVCANSDGCCPAACNANNDNDCRAICGNGVKETPTETCDTTATAPADLCPNGNSCTSQGCNFRSITGTGCQATCVTTTQTMCVAATRDGCCPAGCDDITDADCAGSCGDGVKDSWEKCDPKDPQNLCPTSCGQLGCNLYRLDNPGTCQAACVANGTQSSCVNGDRCCPGSCNANTDNDCTPKCSNNVVEPGETCDGNCPTCPAAGTCESAATGSAATCDLRCPAAIRTCGAKDMCCPFTSGGSCTAGEDGECGNKGGWRSLVWPTIIANGRIGDCTRVPVYQLVLDGSYMFTTCRPVGSKLPQPSGNMAVTGLFDAAVGGSMVAPADFANKDCNGKYAIPQMAGWDCSTDSGRDLGFCSNNNTGGFILNKDYGGKPLYLQICGEDVGKPWSTPLIIIYNAATIPGAG